MKLNLINKLGTWVNQTPLKALEQAYNAAQAIKGLEDQHFNSQKISVDQITEGTRATYFQIRLDKYLMRVRLNLTQFKISSYFSSNPDAIEKEVLEKLAFIDSVVLKYKSDLLPVEVAPTLPTPTETANKSESNSSDGTFWSIANQITQELNPKYEPLVIQELRYIRQEGRIAIKFLLLLILIPFVVQLISKQLVFPIFNNYYSQYPNQIQLNLEERTKVFTEFMFFKEKQEFTQILLKKPIPDEKRQEQLTEKVTEIFEDLKTESIQGKVNMISDTLGFLTLVLILLFNKSKAIMLRDFAHRSFNRLNDPTKIFVFILLTDLFVGYHSAEGWEVLLGGIASHYGFTENKSLIYSFIATIPVIVDSLLKFWIFNYLTRSSPTSVAIYEKMNQ